MSKCNYSVSKHTKASLVAQIVKKSPCNVRDLGLIPESGRSPGEGTATQSSILACKIPWTV